MKRSGRRVGPKQAQTMPRDKIAEIGKLYNSGPRKFVGFDVMSADVRAIDFSELETRVLGSADYCPMCDSFDCRCSGC